jgi:hypothetical protein
VQGSTLLFCLALPGAIGKVVLLFRRKNQAGAVALFSQSEESLDGQLLFSGCYTADEWMFEGEYIEMDEQESCRAKTRCSNVHQLRG